jgi:hypothetical protein
MRTEMARYMDPNTPLATRLFFRSCVESSPSSVESSPTVALPPKRRGDGAHLQLHQLKRTLLQSALEETCDAGLLKRLCGAANEAAELAWATSQPLLVFPCLFEELMERVRAEFLSRSGRMTGVPEMALADAGGGYGGNADFWAGRHTQPGDAWKGD